MGRKVDMGKEEGWAVRKQWAVRRDGQLGGNRKKEGMGRCVL